MQDLAQKQSFNVCLVPVSNWNKHLQAKCSARQPQKNFCVTCNSYQRLGEYYCPSSIVHDAFPSQRDFPSSSVNNLHIRTGHTGHTAANRMLPFSAFSLALASSVELSLALSLETADFNATHALIEQGVNVSAVPALASLADQSSVLACSIAVSHALRLWCSPWPITDNIF